MKFVFMSDILPPIKNRLIDIHDHIIPVGGELPRTPWVTLGFSLGFSDMSSWWSTTLL